MSRLSALDRADLPDYEPLFQIVESVMGFLPNSMLTMARNKPLLDAFSGMAMVVNGPGEVSSELKSLIAFICSRSAGCDYCMAHTSHTAVEMHGVAQDKFDAIWAYETSDHFSPAERAALMVAQGAGASPNAMTDEDFERLKDHYTDDQIVEIVAVVSLFGFLNRWNSTMSTDLERSPLAFGDNHLKTRGWSGQGHR